MIRRNILDEIAAVRLICRDLGLEVSPTLLKAAHHSTFLLSPHAIIARVQSAEPIDIAWDRAVAELAVTRYLADHGAPVIGPLAKLAGPYLAASSVVTLWPYLGHHRVADEGDAALAAATLAAVHRELLTYDGDLPPYTHALDRCWTVLIDENRSAALAERDRDLLKSHYLRLRHRVEGSGNNWIPLHGDVHLGNVLLTRHEARWIDFEDACRGPREYDIAGLPRDAWTGVKIDRPLVETCSTLKSVCVAIWCSADISRSAEVREAGEYHLNRVRQLAI